MDTKWKLEAYANRHGFCCGYAFLISKRKIGVSPLARAVGCSRQTVYNWREALITGRLQCPQVSGLQMHPEFPCIAADNEATIQYLVPPAPHSEPGT